MRLGQFHPLMCNTAYNGIVCLNEGVTTKKRREEREEEERRGGEGKTVPEYYVN